ncbi:MAG TPA: isoprenylcysteine carboxylmethyltransferase family protein, partial [Usitatibacter sp.]|nr:isoprenylcysteine carboxylmethyltransferase family protein [Usitatibacter sp.]
HGNAQHGRPGDRRSAARDLMAPSIRASKAYAIVQGALIACFALICFWHPGDSLFDSAAIAMAGLVLCAVGLALIAAGIVTLGRNIQVAPHVKEGARLVQRGIFRYLRHPIYTGMAACVVGLWLKAPYISVGAAGAALIFFLGVKRRVEEQFLLEAYPEYAQYRRHTLALP